MILAVVPSENIKLQKLAYMNKNILNLTLSKSLAEHGDVISEWPITT